MTPTLFDTAEERPIPIEEAIQQLALAEGEERGAVYTRREVVDFILDLAGYLPAENLPEKRLLEPSFGQGEFVMAAAERLLASFFQRGGTPASAFQDLSDALRAVEVHRRSYESVRRQLGTLFEEKGLSSRDAERLAEEWLVHGDFLLTPLEKPFTHVVGNPPYVRQERIPDALIATYRQRYECIYDRADLYVPFIERGLRLLAPGGRLTFICADRWMKNRYGRLLRQLVAREFRLESYVDMTDTDAFEGEVSAYPATFTISLPTGKERQQQELTRTARRPHIEPESLRALASELRGEAASAASTIDTVRGVVTGQDPWLLDQPREVSVLRRLENAYPKLEEAGCKVGIGVATGADRIFIRPYDAFPVEESRKLPILKTDDVRSGSIDWQGRGVLNPFAESGELVDLDEYPELAAYLRKHEEKIKGRHVARKYPDRWYRTIDKIHPELTGRPKLLIPDIKGAACVAYDEGNFYPHHNLYWITSRKWDLRALQAVLRSAVAEFFVAMYSVRMRGGYLRYQAQYLRRIRIPRWSDVAPHLRKRLQNAAEAERGACDEAAFALYGLSPDEREVVRTAVYEAERAS